MRALIAPSSCVDEAIHRLTTLRGDRRAAALAGLLSHRAIQPASQSRAPLSPKISAGPRPPPRPLGNVAGAEGPVLLNNGLAHAVRGAGTRSLIAAEGAAAKGCRREERRLLQQHT